MLQITKDFKNKVVAALLEVRSNYDGSDTAFAKQWSINGSVYNRIKNGEIDGLLKDAQWLNIGRELNVNLNDRKWIAARTDVFSVIEEDIEFCQLHAKAKIFVDESEIGKSFAAKHLSRTRKNCFYVDASQAKTKQLFIRLIAKTIGVDSNGKYADVKANIKYYLKILPNPIVIVDEAGDLEYKAFLELKEFWNATENACGWYMVGADGLRDLIERGIRGKKVGYRELFSRFSSSYSSVTPIGENDRVLFYKKLITDVLSENTPDKKGIDAIVKRCITKDENGNIGGLRRAESLLILNS